MAAEKKTEKIRGLPGRHTIRQAKFVKEIATSDTLGEAAVKAGYSSKHPRQSGHQALKALRGRVPDMMDRLGLSEETIIDRHLRRHLVAKKTVYVREERVEKRRVGRRVEEVVRRVVTKHVHDDNQTQVYAMDKAFLLHGSYAPRDPKEAAQFGVKVIINDVIVGPELPPIDIKPGMAVPALPSLSSAENGNKNGNKKNGRPKAGSNGHG